MFKWLYYGVDVGGLIGMLVYVLVSGKVILVKDLYYFGNILIMDYGMGVFFIFFYLDFMDVKVGEYVE